MVTAVRADGKGVWTTISGNDGIYSIPNVAPGEYRVSSQADGYPDTAPSVLQVLAGRATRTDISMAGTPAGGACGHFFNLSQAPGGGPGDHSVA